MNEPVNNKPVAPEVRELQIVNVRDGSVYRRHVAKYQPSGYRKEVSFRAFADREMKANGQPDRRVSGDVVGQWRSNYGEHKVEGRYVIYSEAVEAKARELRAMMVAAQNAAAAAEQALQEYYFANAPKDFVS